MARRCVGFGRFAKANKMPKTRGFKADAELVCGKPRDYIYLGKVGNTGRYGAKYGKGGCKFGCRYECLNKAGKMRTGCKRTKAIKLRISATQHATPGAIIPEYAVKRRGPRKRTMALASMMN